MYYISLRFEWNPFAEEFFWCFEILIYDTFDKLEKCNFWSRIYLLKSYFELPRVFCWSWNKEDLVCRMLFRWNIWKFKLASLKDKRFYSEIFIIAEDFKGDYNEGEGETDIYFSHRGKSGWSVNDLEEKLISMESKIDSRPTDTGNGIRDEREQSREMKPHCLHEIKRPTEVWLLKELEECEDVGIKKKEHRILIKNFQ